jgi:hypothetical protein
MDRIKVHPLSLMELKHKIFIQEISNILADRFLWPRSLEDKTKSKNRHSIATEQAQLLKKKNPTILIFNRRPWIAPKDQTTADSSQTWRKKPKLTKAKRQNW